MRAAALALLLVCAWPAAARADDSTEVMTDAARAKAEEGLKLFAAARWAEAYEAFRVAEELFHAPTLVLRMAHCQRELGHLLAARDGYRRVAAEKLVPDAPDAYRRAQAEAKQALGELDPRIPRVRIAVTGASAAAAKVTLDGQPAALAPAVIELDPGPHRIEAKAPGAEALEKRVQLAAGDDRTIAVALEPLKPKTVVVTRREPAVGLAPGLAVLGVGVAGLVAGAATGIVVLGKVSDLRDQCDGFTCPRSLQDQRDAAKPIATASTVSFALAGVALAAGTTLVALHFATGDKPDARTAWSVGVTPGGGALLGRW